MSSWLPTIAAIVVACVPAWLAYRASQSANQAKVRNDERAAVASDASAQKTHTEAYLLLVQPLKEQIASMSSRLADLERRERIQDDLLAQHTTWDRLATRKFAEHGIDIGVPPPLYPSDAP